MSVLPKELNFIVLDIPEECNFIFWISGIGNTVDHSGARLQVSK